MKAIRFRGAFNQAFVLETITTHWTDHKFSPFFDFIAREQHFSKLYLLSASNTYMLNAIDFVLSTH